MITGGHIATEKISIAQGDHGTRVSLAKKGASRASRGARRSNISNFVLINSVFHTFADSKIRTEDKC